MGRPIKEKFFGNTNSPYSNQAKGGSTGVGGEGVNAITVVNSGTLYSQGSTVAISSPQIPGGVAATISYSINSAGNIAVTKLTEGTGYTSTATVAVTKATTKNTTGDVTDTEFTLTNVASVTGIYQGMLVTSPWGIDVGTYVSSIGTDTVTLSQAMSATSSTVALAFSDAGADFGTITTLTSTKQNAIKGEAYVAGGSQKAFDIKKQEASKRYLVQTADGTDQCKLVTTSTLAAGQMNIEATDANGSKYYVRKLTARRAVLVQTTASGSFAFANNSAAGWTLGAASAGIVTIGNN
jgi:hypothetical protein